MKRRYNSVGVRSGLGFYDWVARMFPKNLYAVEEDRPKRILPVPVLAEPEHSGRIATKPCAHGNDESEARESTWPDETKGRPNGRSSQDSRGGQKPFDRKAYMKKYMEDYRQKPVVCPNCGHTFSKLKRIKR